MALPLPRLDDRRWADLVEEGQALIPLYAPEWTDHNAHDPGITLIELLAWVAEMDLFRVDQVTDRHRRKFLALAGIHPESPRPARTVLRFATPSACAVFPAGTEVEGRDVFGIRTGFRTLAAVTVTPIAVVALQVSKGSVFHDLTAAHGRGEPVALLGADPRPGTALYIGFSEPPPVGVALSLYLSLGGDSTEHEARARLVAWYRERAGACRTPWSLLRCDPPAPAPALDKACDVAGTPPHHAARTVWEYAVAPGVWRELDATRRQVEDETRACTLSGAVRITAPASIAPTRVGAVDAACSYIRCRIVAGRHDAAPELLALTVNGVRAEQALTPGAATRTIPGAERRYETAGRGSGAPGQHVLLSERPLVASSLDVLTFEHGTWCQWNARDDFDASRPGDFHYVLDPVSGIVTFGDGACGRLVPENIEILAAYSTTRGEAGNLPLGTPLHLVESADGDAMRTREQRLEREVAITIARPATGGAAGESVARARGRALVAVATTDRAVTLADYERLARETPGVRLARATAFANRHPRLWCLAAPGVVTLVVLPSLPAERPAPRCELLAEVAAYLRPRRIIGTRVEVVGPMYLELGVHARIAATPGVDRAALRDRVAAALDDFFHPLRGGPDASGWPFGRDVYRSEVLQLIDEMPGVDHVETLELVLAGKEPVCGNVCLGPLGLVAALPHQIEVV